jgi:DNA-binding CsgD family transcriptional regulator
MTAEPGSTPRSWDETDGARGHRPPTDPEPAELGERPPDPEGSFSTGTVEPERLEVRKPTPARTAGLGPLGLSPVEERVYRQVIATGGGSARGTAQLLRLPQVEVEQALVRLQALGLITRNNAETLSYVPGQGVAASGSREVQYVPEPPTDTLGALLQTHAANLISAGATVEQLARLYGRRQPDEAHVTDAATVVVGSAVNEAVYEMLCTARVEILNLDRQPFVRPVDPHPLVPAMLDALERGVAVRTIYASDAFRVAGYNEYIRLACDLGEQARLLPQLPIRFMVSDGASGILPLAAEGAWVTAALVVHGQLLVQDLVHTFEDLWARAATLSSQEPDDDAFSEPEMALLRMLSTDMTDTAISRHLGTSPRTIGRRLAQLQHKLGAHTRFGMGVEATRRGLL